MEIFSAHKKDGLLIIGATKFTARVATFLGESFKDIEYEREKELMARFVADFGLNFPVATDREGANFTNYKVNFIPTLVLVDRSGTIRKVGHLYGRLLENHISRLLEE